MTRMTIEQAALAVVHRLRENGHQALWAGGCVRDMLLGREPADIDVATDAHPDRIVGLFRPTRKVGMQFGVVLVKVGPHWIETATFRSDINYSDGRHPESVIFTTAEEDAQRRDFTINGLFYDPVEKRIIDYVGGQADLKAGLIRAIGEPGHRFEEDHLRLLRAVRFGCRFNFQIEPETALAIREHAGSITRISPERIREELDKMLAHPSRAYAVEQLVVLGLLEHLWIGTSIRVPDVQKAIKRLAALPPTADFVLSLAALLQDLTAEQVRELTRALRSSNQQTADITWLVKHSRTLDVGDSMSLAAFKRLLAHQRFDDLLALHEAVCLAEGSSTDRTQAARARRDSIPPSRIVPPAFVTGQDLIATGLEPGPRFKHILDTLYDAQLNDELTTRDAALLRVRELLNNH